jgi:hypothetical protein
MLGVSGQSTAIPRGDAAILTGKLEAAQDRRLSLKECRRLMDADCKFSDMELAVFRDQLYAMADTLAVEYAKRNGNRKNRQEERLLDVKAA